MRIKHKKIFILTGITVLILTSCSIFNKQASNSKQSDKHPRIVNIINFIRLLEPRDKEITEEVLYQTVVNQIELMNRYKLGGTFLLQYDALLSPRYQQLLKNLPDSLFEIGAWWEIPQPLVENAGLKWRGRYSWDWHADVGFSIGYSPEEREKLVDVYMKDFRQIFGHYPKSVGCWFIDAHTLNYMYQKYGIVASCNCRDQIGTDGYSLWGGYMNLAYYPSKQNSYMPAQNESNQIPVPIFRMLGSDPVPQYNQNLKMKRFGNFTMEPVYSYSGADSTWVNWYFKMFTEDECLGYNYVQIGQENSFTWANMSKGLELQLPLIARLRDENKLIVQTLANTGQWFRKKYPVTPATAITVMKDLPGSEIKTVWFNSKFYRANFLWENQTLRIPDIHLFDENLISDYLINKCTSNQCFFYTLPFVDGYTTTPDQIDGLRFFMRIDGKTIPLKGADPVIEDSIPGKLRITWPLTSTEGKLIIELNERQIKVKIESKHLFDWFLSINSEGNMSTHIHSINTQRVLCNYSGKKYSVTTEAGHFSKVGTDNIFEVSPAKNCIVLNLDLDLLVMR